MVFRDGICSLMTMALGWPEEYVATIEIWQSFVYER